MKLTEQGITVSYEQGHYEIIKDHRTYTFDQDQYIRFTNKETLLFTKAESIQVRPYQSGTHFGLSITYENFPSLPLSFQTIVRVNRTTEEVVFEWIVLQDMEGIEEIAFPGTLLMPHTYSVLPYMQGVLLPSSTKHTSISLPFQGMFCSAAAYLSMIGQYNEEYGYMCIVDQPWDTRYGVEPSEKQGYRISLYHLSSLGLMREKRSVRYQFLKNCDYNTMAKHYREDRKEKGYLRTLREKAIALPNIERLIGSCFVHAGICTYVQKDSTFYDPFNPEKNNHVVSFRQRLKEMQEYHKDGIQKLYLHLDGWGIAYDNGHPDVLPVNEMAGGVEGMKQLVDGMKEMNYLFGIHDQYRDYYHRASSHSYDYAVQSYDHSYPEHSRWAGGKQNYLCATLAKDYVKRNFTALKKLEISMDCAYLDVFTCNEMDECANPMHRMTRKQCAEAREACFQYCISQNIIPSSEECSDYAIRSLVFAHYGPYDFMMNEEEISIGIPIPLFNLVYHDCIILPWLMEKGKTDFMLYALLNGGAPYLRRDAAYPNIDGAFEKSSLTRKEQQKRCEIVCQLHEQVAKEEMVRHELLDAMGTRQKTTFANGITVIIDTKNNTYEIQKQS